MKTITLALSLASLVALPAFSEETADLEGRTQLMRVIESGLEAGALDEAESAMADFRRRYPAA
ncbi:MAG: hypothetical protein O7A98_03915, partial [Acidobacteria bacterium]|nr:hypothetical protein [Acidobacteriota bacterium]